jgi:hypothetical protein
MLPETDVPNLRTKSQISRFTVNVDNHVFNNRWVIKNDMDNKQPLVSTDWLISCLCYR